MVHVSKHVQLDRLRKFVEQNQSAGTSSVHFLSPLFTVKNRIEDAHGGCTVLFLVKIIYDDVSVNTTFVGLPLAKRMNKNHSHKPKANA